MRKNDIVDASLVKAVGEMEAGLIDAELGGSLYKKRIALSGMGKRGGIRIIYYNVTRNGRIYLALIYPKNEQDDLTEEQRKALKLLSEKLL